jgi:hypothetical protein
MANVSAARWSKPRSVTNWRPIDASGDDASVWA